MTAHVLPIPDRIAAVGAFGVDNPELGKRPFMPVAAFRVTGDFSGVTVVLLAGVAVAKVPIVSAIEITVLDDGAIHDRQRLLGEGTASRLVKLQLDVSHLANQLFAHEEFPTLADLDRLGRLGPCRRKKEGGKHMANANHFSIGPTTRE